MAIEEHKVVVEQELMQKVIVQVLRNQAAIMDYITRQPFLKPTTGGATIIPAFVEMRITEDLISELED